MTTKEDLENNKTDYLVSVAKASLGVVPGIGSILGELVGSIIPNQRIDRVTKYLIELNEKLEQIPTEKLSKLLSNEGFIDLLEESFHQASKIFSNERRNYIITLVVNGVSHEEANLAESKFLLKLLQEINDIEFIWLLSFSSKTLDENREFYLKHRGILDPYSDEKSVQDAKREEYFNDGYKFHLERLGLIKTSIKYELKQNRYDGKQEIVRSGSEKAKITPLGTLLLKTIGLI